MEDEKKKKKQGVESNVRGWSFDTLAGEVKKIIGGEDEEKKKRQKEIDEYIEYVKRGYK